MYETIGNLNKLDSDTKIYHHFKEEDLDAVEELVLWCTPHVPPGPRFWSAG